MGVSKYYRFLGYINILEYEIAWILENWLKKKKFNTQINPFVFAIFLDLNIFYN